MRLQKARRDFETLKGEEKDYLDEREVRAKEHLKSVDKQIESSTSLLGGIADRVTNAVKDYRERFTSFVNNLEFFFKRTDAVIESAGALKDKAEKLLSLIGNKYEDLQEFEEKLGTQDRELVKREAKVEQLIKETNEKLAEAEQLADWAHNPKAKRYTIMPKRQKRQ